MFVHPMQQKQQIAYADVFYWREVPFVLFIVKPLRLRMVQWMAKCDLPNMMEAVKTLCCKAEAKGYTLTEIVTDPAKQLSELKGKVPYNIDTVGSRTHVADAEVEIRIIKERIRSAERGLPFNLPRRLVKWIVYGCIRACNITLSEGQTTSPRENFTGVKPNYKRDFRAEFGEYVQATVMPGPTEKNGPKPRAVGAIALCGTGNDRGT